jgi:hypothetical protein
MQSKNVADYFKKTVFILHKINQEYKPLQKYSGLFVDSG